MLLDGGGGARKRRAGPQKTPGALSVVRLAGEMLFWEQGG